MSIASFGLRALVWGAALCWTMTARAEPSSAPKRGSFEVMTYNVAGLPEGLSAVRPLRTLPVVGARLNKFDLVLIQEDYAYPEQLRSQLRLPYASAPFARGKALHFGDGLSLFAKLPFKDVRRAAWSRCHGVMDAFFDCLTPKGLAMARVEISPGALVDVYDVHFDAGGQRGDIEARRAQLAQLFQTVEEWSGDRPVIVGGDFNLTSGELEGLRSWLRRARFREACDALRCGQSWRLDRVLFRSGRALSLSATRWRLERSFIDEAGAPLSDHLPVVVTFAWRSG